MQRVRGRGNGEGKAGMGDRLEDGERERLDKYDREEGDGGAYYKVGRRGKQRMHLAKHQ